MDHSPRKEPTQKRSRETVDAILQSVVALVEAGDPRNLTTTRIAEKAGVSIGSLYQYFPSKDAIFSKLIEFYLRNERELILKALRTHRSESLENAIDAMLNEILRIRTRNLRLERALMQFFARAGDPELFRRLDEEMIAEIDGVLIQSATEGTLSRTETTAFLLLHAVRSTFIAATLENPEIYQQPEGLKRGLKKMILALLQK